MLSTDWSNLWQLAKMSQVFFPNLQLTEIPSGAMQCFSKEHRTPLRRVKSPNYIKRHLLYILPKLGLPFHDAPFHIMCTMHTQVCARHFDAFQPFYVNWKVLKESCIEKHNKRHHGLLRIFDIFLHTWIGSGKDAVSRIPEDAEWILIAVIWSFQITLDLFLNYICVVSEHMDMRIHVNEDFISL